MKAHIAARSSWLVTPVLILILTLLLAGCQNSFSARPTATVVVTRALAITLTPESTSSLTPTSTTVPTKTARPSSTLPPSPSPTASPTPPSLPQTGRVLTGENAAQLQELAKWGEGRVVSQQSIAGGNLALLKTAYDTRLMHLENREIIVIFDDLDQTLVSADDNLLVVSFEGKSSLEIWSLAETKLLATLEFPIELPRYPPDYFSPAAYQSVMAMTFSRDGGMLAVGFGNAEIGLWSTNSWEQVAVLTSNISSPTQKLVFSRDGRFLASQEGGRVVFWQLDDYTALGYAAKPGFLGNDPFSEDSTYFVTSQDYKIMIWKLRGFNLVNSFAGGCGWAPDVRFAPDEDYLIVENSQIRRVSDGIRLNAEKEAIALAEWGLSSTPVPEQKTLDGDALVQDGYYPAFQDMRMIMAGRGLLAWGVQGARIYLLRLPEKEITSLDLGANAMNQAALSLDEQTLAVCLTSKELALVDLESGEIQRIPGCRENGLLAYLPDGRLLRANGQLVDVVVLPSGEVSHNLRGHNALVQEFFVSSDGLQLLTGTQKLADYSEVFLWNTQPVLARVASFKIPDLTRGESPGVEALMISPDGNQFAAARGSGMVDAYQLPGKYQLWIGRVGRIMTLAYSPDSSLLALGDAFGDVLLVETARGKQIYPMTNETSELPGEMAMEMYGYFGGMRRTYALQALVFLPDGTGFYTAGDDGIVRLWGLP